MSGKSTVLLDSLFLKIENNDTCATQATLK